MAVDEALLLSFDPASSQPLLRLYGWEPPALSLGRFQDAAAVLDLDRCRAGGVPVVRRITGGGVIYHADELTYSIVCAPHHLPPSSIKESFRHLTAFLLTFYGTLGLHPRYATDHGDGRRLGERTPFCFAGHESYDILINGRKIGGNAQRRLKEVIFQHGSIPLVNRAGEGGDFMRERPLAIGEGTVSLREAGVARGEAELKLILAESFREVTAGLLREDPLSPREESTVGELLGKYRDDRWNIGGATSA